MTGAKRRFFVLTVPLAALWAGAAVAGEWSWPAEPGAAIKGLLAGEVGEAVCFSGEFTGHRINVRDYLEAKQAPAAGPLQFAGQVTRPEQAIRASQDVRSITLLIERLDTEDVSLDEMHGFRLQVSMSGWRGPLYAAGACPWRAADKPIRWLNAVAAGNTSTLYCGMDCDGGGIEVERAAGSRDVILRFEAAAGGLRMSGSYSDEAHYYLGGSSGPFGEAEFVAERAPVEFRLSPMPDGQCEAFRRVTDNSAAN